MIKTGIISLTVCALAMSASVLPAEDLPFTQGEMDSFVAAMISVDCKADSETGPAVEKATGFSDEKLEAIVDHLMEAKLIARVDDGEAIKLIDEGCP